MRKIPVVEDGLTRLLDRLGPDHSPLDVGDFVQSARASALEMYDTNGGYLRDDWYTFILGMITFADPRLDSYGRAAAAMKDCAEGFGGLMRTEEWVKIEMYNFVSQFGESMGEPALTRRQEISLLAQSDAAYMKRYGEVSEDYLSFFLQLIMIKMGNGQTVYEQVMDGLRFHAKTDGFSRDDIGALLRDYLADETLFPEEDPEFTPMRLAKGVSDWALRDDYSDSRRERLYSALMDNLSRLKDSDGAVEWDESLPLTVDEARRVIRDCDAFIGDPVAALIWIRAARRIRWRLNDEHAALLSRIAGVQFFGGDEPLFCLRAKLSSQDFGGSESAISDTLTFLSRVFRSELFKETGRKCQLLLEASDFETELG